MLGRRWSRGEVGTLCFGYAFSPDRNLCLFAVRLGRVKGVEDGGWIALDDGEIRAGRHLGRPASPSQCFTVSRLKPKLSEKAAWVIFSPLRMLFTSTEGGTVTL